MLIPPLREFSMISYGSTFVVVLVVALSSCWTGGGKVSVAAFSPPRSIVRVQQQWQQQWQQQLEKEQNTRIQTSLALSRWPLEQSASVAHRCVGRNRVVGPLRMSLYDALSEDCVYAVTRAQQHGKSLSLNEVNGQVLLAGVVENPETDELEGTLKKYGITWPSVAKALKKMYRDKQYTDDNSRTNHFKAFREKENEEKPLPFSDRMQYTLKEAQNLSRRMGCTEVQAHHLFLALLEYKPPEDGDEDSDMIAATAATIDREIGKSTSEAWMVIRHIDGFDRTIKAMDICRAVLKDLDGHSWLEKELVTGSGNGAGHGQSAHVATLSECGVDLTKMARDGLLDPVYGRDKEIRSCLRTLVRRRKNNVCLLGDAGVGKTAIAEGIAQLLVNDGIDDDRDRDHDDEDIDDHDDEEKDDVRDDADDRRRSRRGPLLRPTMRCPPPLKGHRLVSIEMANLVAGTKYRGEFEERLQSILKEITDPKNPPTILFIDEIHNVVGAGAAEGGMDAANLLKPAMARGQIQVIGATTIAEYRKTIEKDAALERRLQPVFVKEPSIEQTVEILQAIAYKYERHHGVVYSPESLLAAAKLSDRYITDRLLPDKAIDLIDEAGAIALIGEEDELEFVKSADMDNHNINDGNEFTDEPSPQVTGHTIATVVSEWTSIPVGKLEMSEMIRLKDLEYDISQRVKGQHRAVHAVARAIRRARSGLRDHNRPVASFLFCGPTGTGKTELCKTVAETYYGSERKDMIRIDMSEYMEKHSTSRLTGPPPGYVGYEEGGKLTEAVRRAPHSVILLDEIEKAHEDVLNLLLQIMEDGILTDGKGRTINFKNTILMMTSNVGSQRIVEIAKERKQTEAVTKMTNAARIIHDEKESTNNIAAIPIPTITSPRINGISSTTTPSNSHPQKKNGKHKPHRHVHRNPEEILKKLRNNRDASQTLREASKDPAFMKAVKTAMMDNGSPAELLKLSQKDPMIASFLQKLSNLLEEDEDEDDNDEEEEIIREEQSTTSKVKVAPPPPLTITTTSTTKLNGREKITNQQQPSGMYYVRNGVHKKSTAEIKVNGFSGDHTAGGSTFSSSFKDDNDSENNDDEKYYMKLSKVVHEELEDTMKPEFLNRLDEIVVFSPLSNKELSQIADLIVQQTVTRANKEQSMTLQVQSTVIQKIMEIGSMHSGQFGARPMRRTAQRYVEDPLSDAIIQGFLQTGDTASIELLSSTISRSSSIGSSSSGRDVVRITRMKDNESLSIVVEDGNGGIGGQNYMNTIDAAAEAATAAATGATTTKTAKTTKPKTIKQEDDTLLSLSP